MAGPITSSTSLRGATLRLPRIGALVVGRLALRVSARRWLSIFHSSGLRPPSSSHVLISSSVGCRFSASPDSGGLGRGGLDGVGANGGGFDPPSPGGRGLGSLPSGTSSESKP